MLLNNLIQTVKQVKAVVAKREGYFTPSCYADTNYILGAFTTALMVNRDVLEFEERFELLQSKDSQAFRAVLAIIFEVLEIDNLEQFDFAMSM